MAFHKLLFHEILRVFYDRLVSSEDKSLMMKLLMDRIKLLGYEETESSLMSLMYCALNTERYQKVTSQ